MSLLSYCIQKGFLLDKETLDLLSQTDEDTAKMMLEFLNKEFNQKIINKTIVSQGFSSIKKILPSMEEGKKKSVERFFVRLGLQIEIVKEVEAIEKSSIELQKPPVKIISMDSTQSKKIEVQDFVKHYRARFSEIRKFLQERQELTNLTSINKISGERQVSIIGIVFDKRITKNKNLILQVEDLTGKIAVLVNRTREDVYNKALDLMEDDIIGIRANGSREILFANDIIYPDTSLSERKRAPKEENIAFLGDLHAGSTKFREDFLLKFADWTNSDADDAEKLKYVFIAGDLIDGLGIYPGQENELSIKNVEGQYAKAAEILGKLRKDIQLIICPGNHDALRIIEPQPLLDERFAYSLYQLKNTHFTTNPATVNIGAAENFSGFNVLLYHGYSFDFFVNGVSSLRLNNAYRNPEMIHSYILKRRHLAPTHTSTLYFPYETDAHIIDKIPDIFVTAHIHHYSASYYNNIFAVSTSCFQERTAFQEKVGHIPDIAKVPMFNLKTRAIKVLDFEEKNET